MTDRFRTAALSLRPYISDTYDLLHAADAVTAALSVVEPARRTAALGHAELVEIALAVPPIMESMKNKRKIEAIKELRRLTRCGLKDAKNAVEDNRVRDFVSLAELREKLTGNPWGSHYDASEPPF